MQKLSIPEGYQTVMPYLIIQNANGFLSFMEKVFDAKEKYKTMRSENVIMHAEVQVGESVIMLAESTDEFTTQNAGLFVYVADADETYKKALTEGAISKMEMADQPYGRSGGITDPFGNVWWITSVK